MGLVVFAIVSVSFFVGFATAGLMAAARHGDDLAEVYQLERNHRMMRRVLGEDEVSS